MNLALKIDIDFFLNTTNVAVNFFGNVNVPSKWQLNLGKICYPLEIIYFSVLFLYI